MRKGWDIWKLVPGGAVVGTWLAAAIVVCGAAVGATAARAANHEAAVQVALADTELAEEAVAEEPKPFVLARIDLSDQTMTIYVDEKLSHTFDVSTGRGSYRTPTGRWQAEWLSPRHRSRKYNKAPMPWSVFFHKVY